MSIFFYISMSVFVRVLTSVVMVLLSGVINPRRPSLRTTAKPSRVTQYSIQQIYAPSNSRDGPPMHTHRSGINFCNKNTKSQDEDKQNVGQIFGVCVCVFKENSILFKSLQTSSRLKV